jgi:hypothetical protein
LTDSLEVPDTATFFIIPVTGYLGRAQLDLWGWLAAKNCGKIRYEGFLANARAGKGLTNPKNNNPRWILCSAAATFGLFG